MQVRGFSYGWGGESNNILWAIEPEGGESPVTKKKTAASSASTLRGREGIELPQDSGKGTVG